MIGKLKVRVDVLFFKKTKKKKKKKGEKSKTDAPTLKERVWEYLIKERRRVPSKAKDKRRERRPPYISGKGDSHIITPRETDLLQFVA